MTDILVYPIIVLAVAYALWGLVAIVRNQSPREAFVIGAAVVELLFWALAEKSRWGTSVLVFVALVAAALMVRLQDIWEGMPGG